jgi:protein gp37
MQGVEVMGADSRIEWTDATVNFWWGCTKVGPGCDHCYAETFDRRVGGAHWGTGTPRRQIASASNTLAKLNRQGGKRVFIQSMSDLFDNEVTPQWFNQAWMHIHLAKDCRIQIVTKRVSIVEKTIARSGFPTWPAHAGLMITVVNQAEADRDIPRLLALKAKLGIPWVGLSMEPLLGPVDLTEITRPAGAGEHIFSALECDVDPEDDEWGGACLDWVIVGGESGGKARPMHPNWARSLRDQCQAAGVPFFFKQWGEWLPMGQSGFTAWSAENVRNNGIGKPWRGFAHFNDGAGGRETHRVGPCATVTMNNGDQASRVGKARAGRLLDGREWNDMPGALSNA